MTGGRAARRALERMAREDAGAHRCYDCAGWIADGADVCPQCGKAQPAEAALTDDLMRPLERAREQSPHTARPG